LYFDWFHYIGRTLGDEGHKQRGSVVESERKNLRDLITNSLSDDELRDILKLAGLTTNEESKIDDEVYSLLSQDIRAIEDLVEVGVFPSYPLDMDTIKNSSSSQECKNQLSPRAEEIDASLRMLESEDPIIVPITTEKLLAQYEDKVPVADQILREMTARKTRTGQRRVSKRSSKRTKLSTSVYLSLKYGCDQEFHSTPASMRRFRSGTTPKKDAVLLKCPLKHRLLIKPSIDETSPSPVVSHSRSRRRGTGRS
jgi:hypothetical protein